MSRIGKAPIAIPSGVTVAVSADNDVEALELLKQFGLPFKNQAVNNG